MCLLDRRSRFGAWERKREAPVTYACARAPLHSSSSSSSSTTTTTYTHTQSCIYVYTGCVYTEAAHVTEAYTRIYVCTSRAHGAPIIALQRVRGRSINTEREKESMVRESEICWFFRMGFRKDWRSARRRQKYARWGLAAVNTTTRYMRRFAIVICKVYTCFERKSLSTYLV